jgi:hypothetical protein
MIVFLHKLQPNIFMEIILDATGGYDNRPILGVSINVTLYTPTGDLRAVRNARMRVERVHALGTVAC